MNGGPDIEVDGLSKRYRKAGVQALDDVSFSVDKGEIFGLLGRNGAGKSTTVRILTTLLQPSTGRAHVCGFDVTSDQAAVRRVVGAAMQEAALDEFMTGREHLVLAGRLTGLGKIGSQRVAAELLEAFGLGPVADRLAGRYSGGMRRRLDVAMAMVRRPQVLFLDEPTTGVDPQGRRALWGLVRELQNHGSTVFLTTQDLAEADELAGRVAIVDKGRIAAIGSPEDLKARFGGPATVRLRAAADNMTRILETVIGYPISHDPNGKLSISVDGGGVEVPSLIARLSEVNGSIESLDISTSTLEDVFVNLTGIGMEPLGGPNG